MHCCIPVIFQDGPQHIKPMIWHELEQSSLGATNAKIETSYTKQNKHCACCKTGVRETACKYSLQSAGVVLRQPEDLQQQKKRDKWPSIWLSVWGEGF